MKLEDAKLWMLDRGHCRECDGIYEGEQIGICGKCFSAVEPHIILHPEAWERVRAENRIAEFESEDDGGVLIPDWQPPNILLPDISQLPLDALVVDSLGLRGWTDGKDHSFGRGYPDDWRPLAPADLIRDMFYLLDDCPHVRFWMPVSDADKHLDVWCEHSITGPKLQGFVRQNLNLTTPTIRTQADADRFIPEVLKCRDLCGEVWAWFEPTQRISMKVSTPCWLWTQLDGVLLTPTDHCQFEQNREAAFAHSTMLCTELRNQVQAAGVRVEEVERE